MTISNTGVKALMIAIIWLMGVATIQTVKLLDLRETVESDRISRIAPATVKMNSGGMAYIGPLDTNLHVIAIGQGAHPTRDHQLILTWDDGTELRMDLPTNRWLRGWAQ